MLRSPISPDGMCRECKKACQAITCQSNPEASEWYCEKCHLSHQMDEVTRGRLIGIEAEKIKQAQASRG
jgi:hypothetical protein